jgi:hypothetical protein
VSGKRLFDVPGALLGRQALFIQPRAGLHGRTIILATFPLLRATHCPTGSTSVRGHCDALESGMCRPAPAGPSRRSATRNPSAATAATG